MEIKNRKANFEYFIEERYEAGIELKGTEIKSIRKGSCDIKDSFIIIKNQEAFLLNTYIAKYEEGNIFNHEERRTRKLLLHKKEIKKLLEASSRDGYSLIPLSIYLKKGKAKVEIGVCKGKKLYDKRETIKKRDLERENSRNYSY
ncbi:MAG TPA: SsrA-binding protein SmpB [Firmicutes bacterium]|nr:ssrA-binding protein [Coprobacillus sp. CAG:605]HCY44939.1 SsrA-binding protein SmpB [Bacillota bacterium]